MHSNKNKLRVGLLIDSLDEPAWIYSSIQRVVESDYAEVVIVVKNKRAPIYPVPKKSLWRRIADNYGELLHSLFRLSLDKIYYLLIDRKPVLPDAFAIMDISSLVQGVPQIFAETRLSGRSEYFDTDTVESIRKFNVDILYRTGFAILKGEVLNVSRYGVWSYHHGDNLVNRGGPAGYWESMCNYPVTGSILQILSEDLDNGKVLSRSFSRTDTMSLTDNRNGYFWKSLSFLEREMMRLQSMGADQYFKMREAINPEYNVYSNRLFRKPNNAELLQITANKIYDKIKLLNYNRKYFDQWILLFYIGSDASISLWRYTEIVPPVDRFWADPHILLKEGRYHIFIEEYPYDTEKGFISHMQIFEDGSYSQPKKVLEESHHLSYPFVFEYEQNTYMIPESLDSGKISLYICTEFPENWELQMHLMEGVSAVDSTLIFKDNLWWLFANMIEKDGSPLDDELFLFYSPTLFSNSWTSHPMNPIVSDCRQARPAGRIFMKNEKLYRPSQNCAYRYGYGFNICEIEILTTEIYKEKIVAQATPEWDEDIVATHTFNQVGKLHVADALRKRRR